MKIHSLPKTKRAMSEREEDLPPYLNDCSNTKDCEDQDEDHRWIVKNHWGSENSTSRRSGNSIDNSNPKRWTSVRKCRKEGFERESRVRSSCWWSMWDPMEKHWDSWRSLNSCWLTIGIVPREKCCNSIQSSRWKRNLQIDEIDGEKKDSSCSESKSPTGENTRHEQNSPWVLCHWWT